MPTQTKDVVMQIASSTFRVAERQQLPADLPPAVKLTEVKYDDPRLERAFEDPNFDSMELGGTLAGDKDWPMDFIYGPSISHLGSDNFLATVAAATKLAGAPFGGVTAVLQGRDGAYYVANGLSAGFYGDGGGDWELSSGDLDEVTVDNGPELAAVVDADGWFDLRAQRAGR